MPPVAEIVSWAKNAWDRTTDYVEKYRAFRDSFIAEHEILSCRILQRNRFAAVWEAPHFGDFRRHAGKRRVPIAAVGR